MRFRIFTQDVGDSGYSGVCDVVAESMNEALQKAPPRAWRREKYIALPHSRRDLWPDGKTGELSPEAVRFVKLLGEV